MVKARQFHDMKKKKFNAIFHIFHIFSYYLHTLQKRKGKLFNHAVVHTNVCQCFFCCSSAVFHLLEIQRQRVYFTPISINFFVPQQETHHGCTQTSKDLTSVKDSFFIYLLCSVSEMPFSMVFKVFHDFLFKQFILTFYPARFIFLPFSSIFQLVPLSILAKGSSSSQILSFHDSKVVL